MFDAVVSFDLNALYPWLKFFCHVTATLTVIKDLGRGSEVQVLVHQVPFH